MKRSVAAICAILLGVVFLVSGGWKVLSPFQTGELLEQAQVPPGYGPLGAATLGTLELLAAFLLFHPRLRQWGGWLNSKLQTLNSKLPAAFDVAWRESVPSASTTRASMRRCRARR